MVGFRERCAIHEAAHATAALILGIPIVSVSIDNDAYTRRAHYCAPHDCGLETIVTLCLSGLLPRSCFLATTVAMQAT
jgi:hypothetical protein